MKNITKIPSWYALPILMGLFQSTLFAATPQFIATTGLSTIQWSVLLSMPTLLFLVLSPQWGKWADRRGAAHIIRYSVMGLVFSIISLGIVWVLGLSLSFVPWVWFFAIAVSRILYGVSASGVMPLCQSLAIEAGEAENSQEGKQVIQQSSQPKKQADHSLKRLGFVSASLSIGRLCGPLLLLVLATQVSWVLGVFTIAAVIVAFVVVRFSVRSSRADANAMQSDDVAPVEQPDPSSKVLKLYLGLAFGVTFYVGYLQFVLGPLFLDWMVSADEATVMLSLAMSVVAVVALLCQIFVVKRLNWRSPWLLVGLAAVLLIASSTLGLIEKPSAVFWILVPMALSIALFTPIYSRRAMAVSQQAKGQISGRLAVAHTAGYPIGSLLAGASYSYMPQLWWLPLSIISATLLLAVITMLLSHARQPVSAS